MRILALDNRGYPSLFRNHPIVRENPDFNIESAVINKINEYNQRLEIKGIIFNSWRRFWKVFWFNLRII